ncbi:hypothetical protein DITRI_Ditri18aG0019800 [Diplodiscus trichospermus]
MGSDSKRNGRGGGNGGGQIPASAKKVVQNLKEAINNKCTDSEIYVVLKDCNMDPNDAIQRLLSQDTFHEVKSRRERRKEMKQTQELKTRANNRTSNDSVSGATEHYFRQSGSIQISSKELDKAKYRKENNLVASIPYSASSILCSTGQAWNEQPSLQSHCSDADNRRKSIGTGDMIYSSLQPSSGKQSTWVGATFGHVTMADIVRMGEAQSKESHVPCEKSYTPQDAFPPNSAIYEIKPSIATLPSQFGIHHDLHFSNVNMTGESGKKSSRHDFDSDWLVNEPITACSDIGATMYSNQSDLHGNKANLSSNHWSDNILASDSSAAGENHISDHFSSDQASNKQIFMNHSGGPSQNDNYMCKDASSHDSCWQTYEPHEGIGRGSSISVPYPTASLSDDAIKAVSSAAVKLQQLSLEERAMTSTEDNCGVVLPNYLQDFSADCSHLSFGTYKSGKSVALSRPQASSSLINDMEETLTTSNGHPSSMQLNSNGILYCNEEQFEYGTHTQRASADYRNYNPPKFSQAELMKIDISDAAVHGSDYVSHSSMHDSSFKNIQQASSALSFVNDPNVRNLPPLPSAVQSDSNSRPRDLLAATTQSMKARDSAAFLASHSISSRYSSSPSSIKNPTTSMSEVLNSGAFSVSHPSSQALLGANLPTKPVLEDHLSAHAYSQNGYPAISQGHTHTPSTLQQAYPDGNVFRESRTGIKYNAPCYRSASMSSLPFSGSYAGYQNLGNSTDIPGSFLHNLSAGPEGRKGDYDDILQSQYRNGFANLDRLQQDNGFATWPYGHGSRTVSTIPDVAYYSLEGANHQLAGYQHGQQHPQLLEALGYPGIYNSQAGIGIEEPQQQQQQNLHDMILNGSQGPSSKQLPNIWQHNY